VVADTPASAATSASITRRVFTASLFSSLRALRGARQSLPQSIGGRDQFVSIVLLDTRTVGWR
jgi:hypothetical protein